ncbi:MAG: NUDIX hydrolase [Pseudomonadota bacterium]
MPDTPADPRLSATILLVRDAPGLQVFMAKRHHQIDFASGALVFPGGKATDDDARTDWDSLLDGDLGALQTAAIAAVRETFEECGVLLSREAGARGIGAPLVDAERVAALAPYRQKVDRGEASFRDLMAEQNLVLALDHLVHFAHWITPTFMPKRFDTHFFLAKLPPSQLAAHDGRETTDSLWISPTKALVKEAEGSATILFPTRLNLEVLTDCPDSDRAIGLATDTEVVTVLPELTKDADGKAMLTISEASGYKTLSVPMSKERANATRGNRKSV